MMFSSGGQEKNLGAPCPDLTDENADGRSNIANFQSPLYGNPDHCFGGSAAKIAADVILGALSLLRLFNIYLEGRRAAPKKNICPSALIEAAD